ncbi:MAG: filamentous hemagglutinin N-terminal domain-containing protein [Candidatus Accumulibacter phosphatis]
MTEKSWRRSLYLARVLLTVALLSMATRGYGGAGIATDGSVGARQTIAGANAGAGRFVIPQTLGSVVGNNLFHSFAKFNIDTGQTADFTTSTAALANVISRVTGGSLSQINGTLKLTAAAGSAPAFFFINPAGVVFGTGAAISVPGAFHVSTADYVKFANGDKFHADLGGASTLSSAAPAAFGFLGGTSASIRVTDGVKLETTESFRPISIIAGDIEIINGGVITMGGDIRVVAVGNAAQEIGFVGVLPVTSGNLAIFNRGLIQSSAGFGDIWNGEVIGDIDGGAIAVSAGSITINGQGGGPADATGIMTLAHIGNAGSVEVRVKGNLSIVNDGIISSNTITTGNASSIEVAVTGNLSIVNGGKISSTSFSGANAGPVKVRAGNISIDGQNHDTGIFSKTRAPASSGNPGSVEVAASRNLSIVNGGRIASDTASIADANTVKVSAGSITIDGQGSDYTTGIFSIANYGSFGNSGSVEVTASENLSIVNGGKISSATITKGNAGTVKVNAGSITIDRQGSDYTTGIFSDANPGSTGNAGSVDVTAIGNGSITISDGGRISSGTFSAGDAGTVKVSAGNIAIDGKGSSFLTGISSQAAPGSSGNAGSVDVNAVGNLSLVNGGVIDSSTFSSGSAGSIKVSAGNIAIDGKGSSFLTGISSQAAPGSSGNAGSVDVTAAGNLSLINGGAIDSSTSSFGTAGSVTVHSNSLRLDGRDENGNSSQISATATAESSGQTGSVTVTANDLTLSNGGQISIENNANVEGSVASALTPTLITVTAPRITLLNSPHAITTESTGNVAAGSIKITASDTLQLDPSGITTTAFEGNGGAIDITAGLLRLDHSQITTSVTSRENGNGGNIRITADSLILNTGFIQANTKAANASGGNVSITTQNLVASGNTLFLGGNTPYTYQSGVFGVNVIQAAAPTGISGTVQISTPKLDVTTSLVGLDTRLINAQVARRLCENTRGSSLVPVGRGGLPLGGADFLSPGQISGIGFVTSPSVSLPTVRASLRTNAFTPCLAAL